MIKHEYQLLNKRYSSSDLYKFLPRMPILLEKYLSCFNTRTSGAGFVTDVVHVSGARYAAGYVKATL